MRLPLLLVSACCLVGAAPFEVVVKPWHMGPCDQLETCNGIAELKLGDCGDTATNPCPAFVGGNKVEETTPESDEPYQCGAIWQVQVNGNLVFTQLVRFTGSTERNTIGIAYKGFPRICEKRCGDRCTARDGTCATGELEMMEQCRCVCPVTPKPATVTVHKRRHLSANDKECEADKDTCTSMKLVPGPAVDPDFRQSGEGTFVEVADFAVDSWSYLVAPILSVLLLVMF